MPSITGAAAGAAGIARAAVALKAGARTLRAAPEARSPESPETELRRFLDLALRAGSGSIVLPP